MKSKLIALMLMLLSCTAGAAVSSRNIANEIKNTNRTVSTNQRTSLTKNSARAIASDNDSQTTAMRTKVASTRTVTPRATVSRDADTHATTSRAANTNVVSRTAVPTSTNKKAKTARVATNKNIVTRTAINTVATRAAKTPVQTTARTAVKTATNSSRARTATTSLLDTLNSKAELTEACKTQYASCMDNYCDILDDNIGRCACSKNIKNYKKTSDALKEANTALQDVAQQIQYIGLDAVQIETLFAETEAEMAMSGSNDNTKLKSSLDKIKNMVINVKSSTASSTATTKTLDFSGMLDFQSDGTFGDIMSLFSTSDSDTASISNQRGETLRNTAHARCKKSVLDACKAQGVDPTLIANTYDIQIDKDCIAYEQALNTQNDEMLATVRNATNVLQRARLSVAANKNSYDLRGCIAALETCMTDEYVCGPDYEYCLDAAGEYIVAGEVVIGSKIAQPDTYNDDIKNMLKHKMFSTKESEDEIVFEKNGKFFGPCAEPLNLCQDYTYSEDKPVLENRVIAEYLTRVLPQIKKAHDDVISDFASECVTDVVECVNNNNYSKTGISNTAINACKKIITTCMSALNTDKQEKQWVTCLIEPESDDCTSELSPKPQSKPTTPSVTPLTTTCNAGYYLPANDTTCTQCEAGFACSGGTYIQSNLFQGRVQCTNNTYSDVGASACTECSGTVDTEHKTCTPTESGDDSGENSDEGSGENSGDTPTDSGNTTPPDINISTIYGSGDILQHSKTLSAENGVGVAIIKDTNTDICYANVSEADGTYTNGGECVVECNITSATSDICTDKNTVTLTNGTSGGSATYSLRRMATPVANTDGVPFTFNGTEVPTLKVSLVNGALPQMLTQVLSFAAGTNYKLYSVSGSDGNIYYDRDGKRKIATPPADGVLNVTYLHKGEIACDEAFTNGEWNGDTLQCKSNGLVYDQLDVSNPTERVQECDSFNKTYLTIGSVGWCYCATGETDENGNCASVNHTNKEQICLNSNGTWEDPWCKCNQLGAIAVETTPDSGLYECKCDTNNNFQEGIPPADSACACMTGYYMVYSNSVVNNQFGGWVCIPEGGYLHTKQSENCINTGGDYVEYCNNASDVTDITECNENMEDNTYWIGKCTCDASKGLKEINPTSSAQDIYCACDESRGYTGDPAKGCVLANGFQKNCEDSGGTYYTTSGTCYCNKIDNNNDGVYDSMRLNPETGACEPFVMEEYCAEIGGDMLNDSEVLAGQYCQVPQGAMYWESTESDCKKRMGDWDSALNDTSTAYHVCTCGITGRYSYYSSGKLDNEGICGCLDTFERTGETINYNHQVSVKCACPTNAVLVDDTTGVGAYIVTRILSTYYPKMDYDKKIWSAIDLPVVASKETYDTNIDSIASKFIKNKNGDVVTMPCLLRKDPSYGTYFCSKTCVSSDNLEQICDATNGKLNSDTLTCEQCTGDGRITGNVYGRSNSTMCICNRDFLWEQDTQNTCKCPSGYQPMTKTDLGLVPIGGWGEEYKLGSWMAIPAPQWDNTDKCVPAGTFIVGKDKKEHNDYFNEHYYACDTKHGFEHKMYNHAMLGDGSGFHTYTDLIQQLIHWYDSDDDNLADAPACACKDSLTMVYDTKLKKYVCIGIDEDTYEQCRAQNNEYSQCAGIDA